MSRLERMYYISGFVFYGLGSLLSITLIIVSILLTAYLIQPANPAPIFP